MPASQRLKKRIAVPIIFSLAASFTYAIPSFADTTFDEETPQSEHSLTSVIADNSTEIDPTAEATDDNEPIPSSEPTESKESPQPDVPSDISAFEVSQQYPSFSSGRTRISGTSRYETSVNISRLFSPGVSKVFIATGATFPDALSAASAAALAEAPLLLTKSDSLPDSTLRELRRLQPAKIYVLGGTSAVSQKVADQLGTVSPVERLGKKDRYSTSLTISKNSFSQASFAVIATGRAFPDALAASGVAGSKGGPVLLVDGKRSSVSNEILGELQRLGVTNIMVAGGTGAVSAGIESQLKNKGFSVARRGGADRYATATAINSAYFPSGSTSNVFLATGKDFPDALSGAAVAGLLSSPLYITNSDCMPKGIKQSMDNLGATSKVIFGGTNAVSDSAANGTVCVPKPAPKPVTPAKPKPPTKPSGPPAGARIVKPGALCQVKETGQIGYTKNGVKMKCTRLSGEKIPRWRAA